MKKSLFLGLFVIVIAALIAYNLSSKAKTAVPHRTTYESPLVPIHWIRLSSEELALSIAVPPSIIAYKGLSEPGCTLPLILGVPHSASVSLMPEFTDCDKTQSLRDSSAYEHSLSKKLSVIPINDSAEIRGIVKSRITNNRLIIETDDVSCALDSLEISIPDQDLENPQQTLPVTLISDCVISPYALSVQYSPTFKKVVLIESIYGYGYTGDMWVEDTEAVFNHYVNLDMYRSIEITH